MIFKKISRHNCHNGFQIMHHMRSNTFYNISFSFIFMPAFPLGRVAATAAPGRLKNPYGQQQLSGNSAGAWIQDGIL